MTDEIGIGSVITNRGLNGFLHDGYGGYGGYGGRGGHGDGGYGGFGHTAQAHQNYHSADNASRERDNLAAEIRIQHVDGKLENKLDRMQDAQGAQHTAILREISDARVEAVRDSLNGVISVNQQIASTAAAAAECCCENRVAAERNSGQIAALQNSVNDLANDRSQDEVLRAIAEIDVKRGH